MTFNKHQTSASHKEANETISLIPNQLLGYVNDWLSQEIQEYKANNRNIFFYENPTEHQLIKDYH